MAVLIIGYGNPSRCDDGVGLVVINGLRQRLGLPLLGHDDDSPDDVGALLEQGKGEAGVMPDCRVDTLFVPQLVPELADTLAQYDRVVFVDAHVGVFPEPVRRVPVVPMPEPSLVSHHIKPSALLDLTQTLYGHAPLAELVSVRGFTFDFGSTLSPQTAAAAQQAIEELWQSVVQYSTPMQGRSTTS